MAVRASSWKGGAPALVLDFQVSCERWYSFLLGVLWGFEAREAWLDLVVTTTGISRRRLEVVFNFLWVVEL